MKTPPRARPVILASLLCAALQLGGCYSRKEASVVVDRLGTTSLEAGQLVAQVKSSDQATAAALKELYTAFLAAMKAKALADLDAKEANFLRSIDEKQAALLMEFGAERTQFILAFTIQVNESIKPLLEKEDELARKANAAQAALKDFPDDKDRQLAESEASAQYLALSVAHIRLVAEAALKAHDLASQAMADKTAAVATLADEARQKVSDLTAAARRRIIAAKPSVAALPESPVKAYDALADYTAAVKKSSDSFSSYLQSNSLATKSFAGSFLSGFTDNLVSAVTGALLGAPTPKPADLIKEGTAIASTLYEEVLHDADTNGSALVSDLEKKAKNAGKGLLKLAGDKAQDYINGKLSGVLNPTALYPAKEPTPSAPPPP